MPAMRSAITVLAVMLAVTSVSGCQSQVAQQVRAMSPPQEAVALRQLQSRRFDTRDSAAILVAAAGVLQDLGFSIEETAPKSGLIVAAKDRSAVESQQVAAQVLIALLAGMGGSTYNPVWDRNQRIRTSIVVRPSPDRSATTARVSFQRVVTNTQNAISRVETISEPEIYQTFFELLSKSAFLEAQEI